MHDIANEHPVLFRVVQFTLAETGCLRNESRMYMGSSDAYDSPAAGSLRFNPLTCSNPSSVACLSAPVR